MDVEKMMVDVSIVVTLIAWSFLCFIIGLCVAACIYDEELLCKWLERELKK